MTVTRRGTDSSGRAIYASDKLWDTYSRFVADPRVASFIDRAPIVQGSWMSLVGGDADGSADTHERGGCFDNRSRNLSYAEKATFVYVASEYGLQYWRRDEEHGGFDEHFHLIAGWDDDLTQVAANQWTALIAGFDGLGHLGRGGPDYERRVRPLVTTPPEDDMTPDQDARLKAVETKVDVLGAAVAKLVKSFGTFRDNEWKRDVKEAARLQRIEEQTAPEKKEK